MNWYKQSQRKPSALDIQEAYKTLGLDRTSATLDDLKKEYRKQAKSKLGNWFVGAKSANIGLVKESFNYGKATGVALVTVLTGVLAMAPFLGKNKQQVIQEVQESDNPVQVYQQMKSDIVTTNIELPPETQNVIKKVDAEIQAKAEAAPQEELKTNKHEGNQPDITVARIIYSEASPITSDKERELVASVIVNRMKHRGFDMGKLKTMKDVVTQKNAFEALNDPKNKNWKATESPERFQGAAKHAWEHSLQLSTGEFKPISGPSGRSLVYYHDKSISLPKSWNNKYWGTIKELETDHFIFYSVYPK